MYRESFDGSNKKVFWQEMWRHEFLGALEQDPVVILPVGSVEQHGPQPSARCAPEPDHRPAQRVRHRAAADAPRGGALGARDGLPRRSHGAARGGHAADPRPARPLIEGDRAPGSVALARSPGPRGVSAIDRP